MNKLDKFSFSWSHYDKNENFSIPANINIENQYITKLSLVLSNIDYHQVDLTEYVVLSEHRDLPKWWAENSNKIYIHKDKIHNSLPVILSSENIPPPQNFVLFLNGNSNFNLTLWGNNGGVIFISETAIIPEAHFYLGGGLIFLGPNVSSTGRLGINCRNNGNVIIEGDCLISSDVKFLTDDCHAVLDINTGKRLNQFGGSILISNHVWIGEKVHLMGDTKISKNNIIGYNSFVRGIFSPPNVIIAGTPAKLVKKAVTWSYDDLDPFL
jgi:acetyltransferase-like isoleucine patch superfamily enzyme